MSNRTQRVQHNGILFLATLGIALVFGAFLPFYPILALLLVLILVGLWLIGRLLRSHLTPLSTVLFIPIFGMFLGWINPYLLDTRIRDYINTLKWLALILPIICVLVTNPRARRLLLQPRSVSSKLFLTFLLWSLISILIRVGFDTDLLSKWLSLAVLYVLAFVAVPGLAEQPQSMKTILYALAGFGLIVLIGSGFMLLFRHHDAMVMGRFIGVASNAIALGIILNMSVLAFFVIGLASTQWGVKVALVVLGMLSIGMLVMTGARGSLFSMLVGLVFMGFGAYRTYRVRIVGLLTGIVLISVSIFFVVMQMLQAFNIDPHLGILREKGGEEVRLMLIENTFEVLQSDPINILTGIGLGMVRKTYYAQLDFVQPDSVMLKYADYFWKLLHNSYLETLVETGLPGLVSILGALGIGIAAARRIASTSRRPESILHYGALSILISGTIEGLHNSVLLASGAILSIWYWTLIGVYSSLRYR